MMFGKHRFGKIALRLGLVFGLGLARPAQAQYGSSFSYYNPRTGFSYSQGAYYGRGYYSGGFSYSNGRQYYSTYNSYGRPYGSGHGYGSGRSYGRSHGGHYRR